MSPLAARLCMRGFATLPRFKNTSTRLLPCHPSRFVLISPEDCRDHYRETFVMAYAYVNSKVFLVYSYMCSVSIQKDTLHFSLRTFAIFSTSFNSLLTYIHPVQCSKLSHLRKYVYEAKLLCARPLTLLAGQCSISVLHAKISQVLCFLFSIKVFFFFLVGVFF